MPASQDIVNSAVPQESASGPFPICAPSTCLLSGCWVPLIILSAPEIGGDPSLRFPLTGGKIGTHKLHANFAG